MNGRRHWLVIATAAVTGLAIAACGGAAPETVTTDTVVPVKIEAAQIGTIRAHIYATGIVTAAPGADLVLVAPAPARIAELPKAEGDRVRRGDVLARFEIPAAVAEVGRQRAEVGRAQARLQNARAAQTRAHDLFDRGIAARKEVEDADRELADAQADLEGARAMMVSAETVAARSVVRATFDGIVVKRFHNPGDLVEASATDAVLRVMDPARVEVTASVPLADVRRVKTGAAARLADDASQTRLKVVSLSAAVDPSTTSVPVRLSTAAPAGLPVGAPVRVEIDAEEHSGVVLVPQPALVREGEQTAVFVLANGKAQRRAVMIGVSDRVHVEVTSGLTAGEVVIVDGHAGLPDGAAVTTEALTAGRSQ